MSPTHYLGIELGSTRIKAVLVDSSLTTVATGSSTWENQLVDGWWSYSLEAVWAGLREAYAHLVASWSRDHDGPPVIGGLGVSAMMHGYLAFDEAGELLVPFRTWRNTRTETASRQLTEALAFTIPQRWSAAHLYQAVLDGEAHVGRIGFLTTLAGYVHWRLTGRKVLGIGDASGMFPIDSARATWDAARLARVQALLDAHGAGVDLAEVLPDVVAAGGQAGQLTEAGARLLDPTGGLPAGLPVCPPEGDAGTGMVATNAVAPKTGNVSAGTSIFAMIVLERPMARLHPEIDLVTTPAGDPVAMVHCNNGASEIDAWAKVFGQFAARAGQPLEGADLFALLFGAALEGQTDGGGLVTYNYLAGEPITGLAAGRPLIVRTPDSRLDLPNLMRSLIMGSFATLSLGLELLAAENVAVESMVAHGGIFATAGVAQRLLAAALGTPVSVAATAAEGGAWGMAVLAAYAGGGGDLGLTDFLSRRVFADAPVTSVTPDPADVSGYRRFLDAFRRGLPLQTVAVEAC